jgi:hypothetical protein
MITNSVQQYPSTDVNMITNSVQQYPSTDVNVIFMELVEKFCILTKYKVHRPFYTNTPLYLSSVNWLRCKKEHVSEEQFKNN